MIAAPLRDRLLRVLSIVLAVPALLLIASAASAAEDGPLWRALRSGEHIGLLRHAMAPGTGDPENFVLGNCSTQRNLSQAGREQAARLGTRLRENGVTDARVYASQWCRAVETAELLRLGPVSQLPTLNSFFGSRQSGPTQTRTLSRWLAKQDLAHPLVLVTHQVNITALTGVYPASGEMVIVRRTPDGALRVVGTLKAE
jgi:phosphohistidine phosphatase SixA